MSLSSLVRHLDTRACGALLDDRKRAPRRPDDDYGVSSFTTYAAAALAMVAVFGFPVSPGSAAVTL